MSKYQSFYLGNYNSFEEAVYARIKAEKELCDEYGSNSEYYYVLKAEDPINEIKKIGFNMPEKTTRKIPLLQKKHCRKSVVADIVLENINKDNE